MMLLLSQVPSSNLTLLLGCTSPLACAVFKLSPLLYLTAKSHHCGPQAYGNGPKQSLSFHTSMDGIE
jgi:hypothetical protein